MLEKEKKNLIQDLKEMVNIRSFTDDRLAVNDLNDFLEKKLKKLSLKTSRFSHKKVGDLLVAQSIKKNNLPNILLVGHTDIVYNKVFNNFYKKGNKLYGNAVADMKSGLAVILGILAELKKQGKLYNITCIFSPEEEIGSPNHHKKLMSLYRGNDYAFVFEPGLEVKNKSWKKYRWLVNERRGVSILQVDIHGDGGHTGNKLTNRNSTIEEMAHKILAWQNLTDVKKGLTVNVGKIEGGEAFNSIPAHCQAIVDLRISSLKQYKNTLVQIKKIAQKNHLKTKIYFSELNFMPPLEVNKKSDELFVLARKKLKKQGFSLINKYRGGGSDANYIGQFGVGILDALGAVGGKLHTPDEWVYESSIFESIDYTKDMIVDLLEQKS